MDRAARRVIRIPDHGGPKRLAYIVRIKRPSNWPILLMPEGDL